MFSFFWPGPIAGKKPEKYALRVELIHDPFNKIQNTASLQCQIYQVNSNEHRWSLGGIVG